jgi:predicted phosphodiesterase
MISAAARTWPRKKLPAALLFTGLACLLAATRVSAATTPTNFKVAFIADQGLGSNAQAVLNLIKSEGASAVVHSGDFEHTDDPPAWEAQVNSILGANFPYFCSIGNHDTAQWSGSGGYLSYMQARMNRIGVSWSGELGVKSYLTYNGILILLTGPGTSGSGHSTYIHDVLAQSPEIWRVSSFHKCQHLMQPEDKGDDTGWGVYEESRQGGAFVFTGHAHAYARTWLLSSCTNQTVASQAETLAIRANDPNTPADEGRTIVAVSGLAGVGIRSQSVSGSWFAKIYTSSQSAKYGALFGVFNYNGNPRLAKFYFKNTSGTIVDSYFVRSSVTTPTATGPEEESLLAFQLAPGNPVRNQVTLLYNLPQASPVDLVLYDVRGQAVRQVFNGQMQAAGPHRWDWELANAKEPLASGVYFARLQTQKGSQTIRMVLVR